MDFNDFSKQIMGFVSNTNIPIIIHGIGSKVISVTYKNQQPCLNYENNNNNIYLRIDHLYKAFEKFNGKKCSENDLKEFMPKTFYINGHRRNCLLFFFLLKELKLCGEIMGNGEMDTPYYVEINGS